MAIRMDDFNAKIESEDTDTKTPWAVMDFMRMESAFRVYFFLNELVIGERISHACGRNSE